MKTAKCGIHVATEMVLCEARPPSWVTNPDGADQTGERDSTGGVNRKMFTRKFWKCPMAGCFRVAAYAPTEEEAKDMAKRPCSECGEPTTGRVYCAACLKQYHERRNARKRELRAARAGLGKGFYSAAKAKRAAREQEREVEQALQVEGMYHANTEIGVPEEATA